MILSEQDINLITKKSSSNLKKEDFVFRSKSGYFQLKNINGHCIFFDFATKLCKIYDLRPKGCRFYPLIYNFEKKSCIFDNECPRPHLFYQEIQEFKDTCQKIKQFLKEQLDLEI